MTERKPDEELLASMRAGERIPGPFNILMKKLFTIEEVHHRWESGLPTPLDLMPHEFWHPPDYEFPRFGEEMLEDF